MLRVLLLIIIEDQYFNTSHSEPQMLHIMIVTRWVGEAQQVSHIPIVGETSKKGKILGWILSSRVRYLTVISMMD